MALLKYTRHVIFVDASLKGMSAIYDNQVYVMGLPWKVLNIVHLEAANILVALTCWILECRHEQCIFWCDNQAVVEVFSNHNIKDAFLMGCVRSHSGEGATMISVNIEEQRRLQICQNSPKKKWESVVT